MTVLLHELTEAEDLSPIEQAFQTKLLAALSRRDFRMVYKLFYDLGAALDFTERVMRPSILPTPIDPLEGPIELLRAAVDTHEVAHEVEVLPHHTEETGAIHIQEALNPLKKVDPVVALIPGVPTESSQPEEDPVMTIDPEPDPLEDSGVHVKVELTKALTSLEELLEDGGK